MFAPSPFTPEQIEAIRIMFLSMAKTHFGLIQFETLPVRDGHVNRQDKVWWRGEKGPEHVDVDEHWGNIFRYPDAYQIKEPKVKVTYSDE